MRTICMLMVCVWGWAQPLTWTRLEAGPSARVDGVVVFDPVGRQLYMFGGQDRAPRNDLWAYSVDRRQWRELRPDGTPPAARFGHTVILDTTRRRLIVFGGQAGGFFSDTWAYDIAANRWAQLSGNEAGPRDRYGHSAVYDAARDRMIVSHGFTDSGRFDDTWAFDFVTNRWRDISPASNRPLKRCLHHAVLDAARDQMLLYGGCSSGAGPCPQGDLWSFDLASGRWREVAGAKPPARQWYGTAFDTARGRMVVFGGSGSGLLADIWEFDAAGGQWREAAAERAAPSARERAQGAYAAGLGAVFFFGGRTASGMTDELWMLSSRGPRISAVTNAFSGQDGAVSPGEIVSIFGSGLGPVTGISAGFDSDGLLPTNFPGVTVRVNGTPAPILYAEGGQLNVQVPYEVAGAGEAEVAVTALNVTHSVQLPVAAAHPGAVLGAVEGGVAVLYATGYGLTDPPSLTGAQAREPFARPLLPVTVRMDGREADLLYVGQVAGTAGVLQINARLPEGASAGLVEVQVGEARSRPVRLK